MSNVGTFKLPLVNESFLQTLLCYLEARKQRIQVARSVGNQNTPHSCMALLHCTMAEIIKVSPLNFPALRHGQYWRGRRATRREAAPPPPRPALQLECAPVDHIQAGQIVQERLAPELLPQRHRRRRRLRYPPIPKARIPGPCTASSLSLSLSLSLYLSISLYLYLTSSLFCWIHLC